MKFALTLLAFAASTLCSATDTVNDIYILVDSRKSFAENQHQVAEDLNRLIFTSPNTTAYGFGLYTENNSMSPPFQNVNSLNTSYIHAMISYLHIDFVPVVEKYGANLAGLYKVATDSCIGWRDNSNKFVLYFGNLPGEDPTCFQGGNLSRAMVISELVSKGIRVISIDMGGINTIPIGYKYSCKCSARKLVPGQPQQGIDIANGTKGLIVGGDVDLKEVISYVLEHKP